MSRTDPPQTPLQTKTFSPFSGYKKEQRALFAEKDPRNLGSTSLGQNETGSGFSPCFHLPGFPKWVLWTVAKPISQRLSDTLVSDSIPCEIPTNVMVATTVSQWCESDFVHPAATRADGSPGASCPRCPRRGGRRLAERAKPSLVLSAWRKSGPVVC